MTPAEQAAIAPPKHPLEIEAMKLVKWCEQPWLSEMDRARYLGWAEEPPDKQKSSSRRDAPPRNAALRNATPRNVF